ncbi:MalY/PatB family protein [Diplocloster hominis]|uniref:MalY/PatB family protein n=1 Tax=Diplocloster hominis TaxID=3079010 RepID=UPI0031BB4767
MQSVFDKRIDRRNTGSMKWNTAEGELPMWVADMDFETAPKITEAIQARARQGVFGYTVITEEWYQAYQSWWRERHHFEIQKDWLVFCTGVVPAISSIVRKLTTPAENIVVMTPVYNVFFNSILNNGRNVLESRLRYNGKSYEINFKDLEEKLSDPQTSMLLLCNPHNPVGKIWGKETLKKIGDLCRQYHVLVLSDEIHCDITKPGCEYVPFASVSENCRNNSITCVAPTKAFNLAGIQTAAVIVPDENLRHRVNRGLNTDEIAEPNVFAAIALVAAFRYGGEWLDKLRDYLWENRKFAEEYIGSEIRNVTAVTAEATYLLWLDCRGVIGDSSEMCRFIRGHSGLCLSDGREYGNGSGFLRMNLACPREQVKDGLERLKRSIAAYEEWICRQC